MKLEFTSLCVKNFGSFIEPQMFEFDKLDVGAYFIKGQNKTNRRLASNGSGKSTFFINALCWVLTGRTPVGLRSTDLKPWNLPKGKRDSKTEVTLTFKIDGVGHWLTRVAPNAISLDNHEVAQEHIDKLLRISSLPVLKQTVIFGQHEPLFFDLPNKDKLALLSEVLELDKWDVRAQKASERARVLERKAEEYSAQARMYEAKVETAKEQLKQLREANKTWKSDNISRVKNYKTELADVKVRIKELQKQSETALRIAKAAAENLGSRQGDQQVHVDKLRTLERDYAVLVERQKQVERQAREIDRELEDLGEADACPTCGQSIKGTDLDKHKKELIAKRDALLKEVDEKVMKKKAEAIQQVKAKISTIRAGIVTLQNEYDGKKREHDLSLRRVTELEARQQQLERSIEESAEIKNPYIEQINKLKASITELEELIVAAKEEETKVRQRYERTHFWIKGFKDVRLFIVEDIIQELELMTNAALNDLGLGDWEVKYDIERETKSGTLQTGLIITILSPANDKPVRWESWSGGEGQRLRLAGSMALSEVLLNHAGVNIDLEIFDEPTKHMNAGGVDDFCELLASRARDLKRRIFLVDHTAIESSSFAGTVTVVKTEKGSHIEQE